MTEKEQWVFIKKRCGGTCECPWCDRDAEVKHHMLKRSLYPHLKDDPRVQVAFCGSCHAICHQRMLAGEDVSGMYPMALYSGAQEIANGRRISAERVLPRDGEEEKG